MEIHPNSLTTLKQSLYDWFAERSEYCKPYKDHICFFHCLAIGKYKFSRHNCNQKAKELFDQFCQYFQVNPQDFKDVELIDFPQLEKYYETHLFVMSLKEDGSAKTLYLS